MKEQIIAILNKYNIDKSSIYYDNIIDEIIALFKAEMPTEEEMIAFANFFHKHKKAIERGECPKRPDELLKEFSNRMKGGKK